MEGLGQHEIKVTVGKATNPCSFDFTRLSKTFVFMLCNMGNRSRGI